MNNDKKIRRSRNRLIAGVCAGIAEYFKINPWVIRGLFIILLLIPHIQFVTICIYVVLLAILPAPKGSFFENFRAHFGEQGRAASAEHKQRSTSTSNRRIIKDVREHDIH
ncbi:PspC domain-containing protein [Liquorilactobacillus capillatus]|uniref:Phage shock protein PspC N-terminal domain-containing protein n=1 Tax=Liquorilactobacillus capillatus DSM 19910 TaxID=1423731 RepID=A0A0R1M4H9_9LACO|nr:PspC domain-containing protein [Liquorilactobacillus capillatus]KRL02910.1 hypothetical protein FC81_GL000400 [Liquorilactobacillus capillatus DSM 19910]